MAEPLQEEVLAVNDIQGNILAGFNKDFQTFLFLKIHDRDISKTWLRSIIPSIANVAEVLAFNRMFRALRARRGEDPRGMIATWMNIAFTSEGIKKLTSQDEVNKFQDTAFKIGMPRRAGFLGDPADISSDGHPNNWVVGGNNPEKYPDILLIVASDDITTLNTELNRIKAQIQALPKPTGEVDGKSALEIIYEQHGITRPDKPGHEHFGFKDGISHPGIRGLVSDSAEDFLTPRLLDPKDQLFEQFAKPGQPLIWPGQFVFGYKQQKHDEPTTPLPAATLCPAWANNGSYLVVRRLRQDVPAFWNFVNTKAAELSQKPGFNGMTPERFATLLVGRWPSGAPLMRSPNSDNEDLAKDSLANNHFSYVTPSQSVSLVPIPSYPGDNFPQARSDSSGLVCPYFAHIRKINPRDSATDTGGANDTFTRLVLRRGIAFGSPIKDPANPTIEELQEERGLMFVSYQASIEEQFEFLMRRWANRDNLPPPGAGPDPIIGQQENAGSRARSLKLTGSDNSTETIKLMQDWVIPTGGGYFFAPSISALKDVLANSGIHPTVHP
ncbi:Dyp-type peroxidase [Scytonema sp. PCC 10023]|uniref:Dyp-type peroxidase n=1 Tax=Scytonema sp. PCC 10023 TaxID=1680591 RepID=UPI0039C5BE54